MKGEGSGGREDRQRGQPSPCVRFVDCMLVPTCVGVLYGAQGVQSCIPIPRAFWDWTVARWTWRGACISSRGPPQAHGYGGPRGRGDVGTSPTTCDSTGGRRPSAARLLMTTAGQREMWRCSFSFFVGVGGHAQAPPSLPSEQCGPWTCPQPGKRAQS